VELDPTKWYWLVLDADSGIPPQLIERRDGMILVKRPGTQIAFVENPNQVEVAHGEATA
jgi:hypothetical protein